MKLLRRTICLFMTLLMVISLLPLQASAATCAHTYQKRYTIENENHHSYVSVCTKCGEQKTGYGYSGWQEHSFSNNTCTICGYKKSCSHTYEKIYSYENGTHHSYLSHCTKCGENKTGVGYSGWETHTMQNGICTACKYKPACEHSSYHTQYEKSTQDNHRVSKICDSCGVAFNVTTASHTWKYSTWSSVSASDHKRTKTCVCGEGVNETQKHTISNGKCINCGYQDPTAELLPASVTLSAKGPSGTLGSGGGEITSESYPASYTVTAAALNCTVTRIVYLYNGRAYSVSGSSVTITADTEAEFQTTTFTAYTDRDGVTATFAVNFKYVKKGLAYIMWETFDTATIRSVYGNGLTKTLSYDMNLPTSYNGQSNLTKSQMDTLQSLIGRHDGKTYLIGYTRMIRVYTPASLSSTGEKVIHALYDGNDSAAVDTCINTWGWTEGTKSAIRQAASSTLAFTTSLPVDTTAIWYDSVNKKELYRTTSFFGDKYVYQNLSGVVSIAFTDYSRSADYVYESLAYEGDTLGTSTADTYSQMYTVRSKPVTVTFYCHPIITKGTITVRAIDGDTNALIPTAVIHCGDKNGTSNPAAFAGLSFGTYSIKATADGYEDAASTVSISQSASDKTVTLKLYRKTGTITVRVIDEATGAVISGAVVKDFDHNGTTDSSGTVSFTNLPLGSYTFTAEHNGYYPGTGTGTISSDNLNTTITISLKPIPTTGTITVKVFDRTTGQAISGASVTGASRNGTTDTMGSVVFASVPFGTHTFTASKYGYYDNTGSGTISLSQQSTIITIYLTPKPINGDIHVIVRDRSTNNVIVGASVHSGTYSGTTNAGGTADFYALPFGTYTFTADKPGYYSGSGSTTITDSAPDKTLTIYLDPITADVSITANPIGGTVYRGSTIMVSATIHGDRDYAFTPYSSLTVKLKATRNGGTNFSVQTKTVICPKSEDNLIWFEVSIPEDGWTADSVSFSFTVTTPTGVTDGNLSNNISSVSGHALVLPIRSVPDAEYSLNPPAAFSYTPYAGTNIPTLSWNVWEWNGGFVKRTYTARLTAAAALTPDSTAVWKQRDPGGTWATRSGYGLNTSVSVSLSGIPADMYTGTIKVNAYYPEFNYSVSADKSDQLVESGGVYRFPVNTASISRSSMHLTPMWFPDGTYAVKYEAYDLWTPAGMLRAVTNAKIRMEGSLYDDYYTS